MLKRLSTGVFRRLGVALAVSAAFCFALPPAVMAMGHGDNTACLSHIGSPTHAQHAMPDHDGRYGARHADSTKPDDGSSDPSHKMTCCGLYCISAALVSDLTGASHETQETPKAVWTAERLIIRTPNLPEPPPKPSLAV
jgi:hypothetical protein